MSGQPEIQVSKIEIEPNCCELNAEVKLTIHFETPVDLNDAYFDLKYIVDVAAKRHIIELGESKHEKYTAGKHVFVMETPKFDLGKLEKHVLKNVGLLACTLKNDGKDVVEIKLMTQVSKNKDGQLIRTVFNPLE